MAYHPPKLEWVKEEDFAIYKDVVKGAYRFHDMMLERLLELAGPETTVILCSDHGFESGSQRPMGMPREPAGPAAWHRQYGIFVMAGPGIKRDERIYGASLVDIAPTVLTLFDLPIGKDMDGRPLLEAFETHRRWEQSKAGKSRRRERNACRGVALEPDQSRELMQQFAALGYIEDPGADKEKVAASAEIEAKYNIARTYLWKGRPDQARPLLEEIVRQRPWEDRFLGQLAGCYFQGGYLRQAEQVLAAIADDDDPITSCDKPALGANQAGPRRLGGALHVPHGGSDESLAGYLHQIGDVFARSLQWQEAETLTKKRLRWMG